MNAAQRLELSSALYVILITGGGLLAYGSGTSGASTPTVSAEALQSSQCASKSFDSTVTGCTDAFASCAQGVNANLDACKTTLVACLPSAPSGSFLDHGHGHHGRSRDGEHHESADGGRPNDGDEDDGVDGGAHEHGRRGHDGHRPAPDPIAIKACHDQLATCVAATDANERTCFDAAHACTQAAFRAAFQVDCTTIAQQCAGVTSDRCARATGRCGEGESGPPDGGAPCP